VSSSVYINCDTISKSFGTHHLFEKISTGICQGDKIGVVGPNGSGKSTLMKILAGREKPDEGTVSVKRGLKIGYVPQMSTYSDDSIENVLRATLLNKEPELLDYEADIRVDIIISKIGFVDPSLSTNRLSGGWKKRLDLAKELILDPDMLLLDEPTNHLDLEGIEWLETFLKTENITFLVISHDRYFLSNVTNRILEINRQFPKGLFTAPGNYDDFLISREEYLTGQIQYQRSLSSKVRYEQEWLKKSPKARTTKATSRIKEAGKLIDELADVENRNKKHTSGIDFSSSDRMTQKLIVAKNVSVSIQGKELFSKLDITCSPGMRLGISGPNGSGKTTLLKMFAGTIEPDMGTIKKAEGLRIVYFDQHRAKIPDNITLREALSSNGDYVNYQGSFVHVNSWCKRFLFNPDRLTLPVSQLSGGEKARISIANLMLEPADILLLDEPTNDLDIPTLEVLEESLQEFPGAIALITHDRCLMDRLCNVFIGLGVPGPTQLFADFRQWEDYKEKHLKAQEIAEKKEKADVKQREKSEGAVKLSYKEKFELEQIESKIHAVEATMARLNAEMENTTDPAVLQKHYVEIGENQAELDKLFHRWEELEKKKG
jgi:ABC transport system ATP-binding/permease protein